MPKQEKIKINVKERVDDNAIDLSLSELQEVPVRDIIAIKRATILDLSNNKILYLAKNFSQLSHITKLDLSKNQIRYLPEDFGNFVNLRHLDLYNNRIEQLPLSFGNLRNLRYLDLKANPLSPGLAKVVGPCLTTKDCHESAKNTVKFLAQMYSEVERAKEQLQDDNETKIEAIEDLKNNENDNTKKTKKNRKKKSKKNKNNLNNGGNNNKEKLTTLKQSTIKNKKSELDFKNNSHKSSKTVFKTIIYFVILLALNIALFYFIFKHPQIADWLVERLPQNYRDIIVSRSEDMRLNVLKISSWIHKFKTPPTFF